MQCASVAANLSDRQSKSIEQNKRNQMLSSNCSNKSYRSKPSNYFIVLMAFDKKNLPQNELLEKNVCETIMHDTNATMCATKLKHKENNS